MLLTLLAGALLAAAEPVAAWKTPLGWRPAPPSGRTDLVLAWQGPQRSFFSLTRLPRPVDAGNRAVVETLLRAGLARMSSQMGLPLKTGRSMKRYTSPKGLVVEYILAEPGQGKSPGAAGSQLLVGYCRQDSADLVVHLAGPSVEATLREILGEEARPDHVAASKPPDALWLWPSLISLAVILLLIRRRWTR